MNQIYHIYVTSDDVVSLHRVHAQNVRWKHEFLMAKCTCDPQNNKQCDRRPSRTKRGALVSWAPVCDRPRVHITSKVTTSSGRQLRSRNTEPKFQASETRVLCIRVRYDGGAQQAPKEWLTRSICTCCLQFFSLDYWRLYMRVLFSRNMQMANRFR